MNPRWLTTEQLMDYLSMSKATVRKLGREAGAVVQYGRTLRFDREAIDTYLEAKKEPPSCN